MKKKSVAGMYCWLLADFLCSFIENLPTYCRKMLVLGKQFCRWHKEFLETRIEVRKRNNAVKNRNMF